MNKVKLFGKKPVTWLKFWPNLSKLYLNLLAAVTTGYETTLQRWLFNFSTKHPLLHKYTEVGTFGLVNRGSDTTCHQAFRMLKLSVKMINIRQKETFFKTSKLAFICEIPTVRRMKFEKTSKKKSDLQYSSLKIFTPDKIKLRTDEEDFEADPEIIIPQNLTWAPKNGIMLADAIEDGFAVFDQRIYIKELKIICKTLGEYVDTKITKPRGAIDVDQLVYAITMAGAVSHSFHESSISRVINIQNEEEVFKVLKPEVEELISYQYASLLRRKLRANQIQLSQDVPLKDAIFCVGTADDLLEDVMKYEERNQTKKGQKRAANVSAFDNVPSKK